MIAALMLTGWDVFFRLARSQVNSPKKEEIHLKRNKYENLKMFIIKKFCN